METSKEQLDDSNEQSKGPNENSNPSEELPNESNDASSSSKESSKSLETPKEYSKSLTDSCEISKELVKTSAKGNGKPELRKQPQTPNQNQVFHNRKLPAQGLREPSSFVKPQDPSSQLHSNAVKKSVEVHNNKNEATNMPVILNVFSLSKGRQSNAKQENSVLFTPPCSPPYVQLGPFSATPVSFQTPRTRSINQTTFHQGQENLFKPVQQVNQNFQQVGSQNKPVKQVYHNFQGYLSYPVQQVSSSENLKYKVYLNQPVQQVRGNFQEIPLKPVQQVGSLEYLNKPVKHVYYSDYQENWAYPVQQTNEYMNKPVKQVYYNPPSSQQLSKPVQPVNLQEYQPVASPEYLPNSAQKVGPVKPQDYVYNPIQQNPQQIANGVLPLEKQIGNQSMCERPVQPNTVPLLGQEYQNHAGNNEQQAMSQFKSTLSDGYLVESGNSMAKGNGMYARFKLMQPLGESNTIPRQPTEILPQFFQIPPIHDGSNIGTVNSGVSPAVNGHLLLPNASLPACSQNEVNTYPNCSTGVYGDKYKTDYGCTAILGGYGKNTVSSNSSNGLTNNNVYNMYSMKQPENSFDTPTMISEKQSVYSEKPFCTSMVYIPSSSGVSEELGRTSPRARYLSPRDAKVIELKQRLEEQEATIKKLRANH